MTTAKDLRDLNDNELGDVSYIVHIKSEANGAEVAKSTQQVRLEHGDNTLEAKIAIASPKLWNTWDRGGQPLYTASLEIVQSQVQKLAGLYAYQPHLHSTSSA